VITLRLTWLVVDHVNQMFFITAVRVPLVAP